MKTSILLAIKREQRNRRSGGFRGRLYDKQATKASQDAVITHVTQVTVEDTPVTKLENPENSLPKTQAEWAKELGIPKQTLTIYMKRHECTLEEAVEHYKSR